MKLTLNKILTINNGLGNLDGYTDLVEVNETQQVVKRPYKFKTYKTTWNITKNKRILREFISDYNETRDSLIKEISGDGIEIKKEDEIGLKKFSEKINELLKEELEVNGLLKLKLSDLMNKSEDGSFNPIPAGVLDDLFDILDDDSVD